MKGFITVVSWLLLPLLAPSALAIEIRAEGLFKGAAVLVIDGRRQMLRVGQSSPEGVTLVSADRHGAEVEWDGRRQRITLSKHITSEYQERTIKQVAIRKNAHNQYITNASLNGRRTRVLVDTGANAIAMNSDQALSLGIDYRQGIPTMVKTASGQVVSHAVKLDLVEVGELRARNVMALVIEGPFPETVLLGMSFLEHVELSEENGVLYLKSRF